MRSLLVTALIAGSSIATPGIAQTLDPDLAEEIETAVEALVDSVPWPGVAVGVVVGDTLAYARGFGVADLETGEAVSPGTLFQIGSVSKSFTATLAAMLVERGLLTWDDPLSAHLPPSSTLPETPVTLGQIADHTSGLPGDAPTLRRKHGDYPILAFTHFELYRSLAASELAFEPGSEWGYSNFGYGVLGHVLELKTGEPYETLLDKELLEPLGMASTTVTIWPELAGRLATPYIPDDTSGELVEYTPWDEEALAPAGGIASTLDDMGRYVAFQMRAREGRVPWIDAAAVRALQSPGWTFESGNAYGKGWFIEPMEGVGDVVSVGGEVDGYTAEIAFAPEPAVGVIVLTNRGNATGLPDLTRWIVARVVGARSAALYRRGRLHQASREWARARQAFEALLERDPGHAAARWRLGMVHERAGRCESAEREYGRAIEEDPGLASAVAGSRESIAACGDEAP